MINANIRSVGMGATEKQSKATIRAMGRTAATLSLSFSCNMVLDCKKPPPLKIYKIRFILY